MSAGGEGGVHGEDVKLGQRFAHGHGLDADLVAEGEIRVGLDSQDAAAEAVQPPRDRATDRAQTDDAHGGLGEIAA
jgi:hypothetical protein